MIPSFPAPARRLLRPALAALALPALLAIAVATLLAPSPSLAAAAGCKAESFLPELRAAGRMKAVEAAAAKVVNGEGRFYRIDKEGLEPSYLLGTMHLGDPRILRLPAPVETAFEESDRLVIETTDILDQMKLAGAIFADPSLTTLPDGQTLDDYLDPAEKASLERMLSAKGVPLQAVERLQPWFLSSGFMLPACLTQAEGGVPVVLDTRLAVLAKEDEKPVEGLETAIEQLKTMAAIPIKEQMDGFVAMLSAEDKLEDVFETMIELYLGEHVSSIIPAIEAAVPEGGMMVGAGEGYNSFEEKVITDRNLRMAERLGPYLSQGATFVAVGALHLPGEKGLVALLRERGYRLTRVPAPPGAVEPAAPATPAEPGRQPADGKSD